MFRCYRSIVVALVGLILLSGASPPAKDDPQHAPTAKQEPAQPPPPVIDKYLPYADKYAETCYNANNHDSADLCAQWRAAIAAEKAADATTAANWISAGGAILSFISIILVLVALGQTRKANRLTMKANARATRQAVAGAADTAKALEIATRNADAAGAQVEVAQEIANAQLMPYVYIERVEPVELDPDDPRILIKLKNFGKTPATNVKVCATFRRCRTGEAVAARIDLHKVVAGPDIPPSHTQTIGCPIDVEDWPGTVDRVIDQTIVIVLTIRVSYSGLKTKTVWRDDVIIFDHTGPRQPQHSDNLRKG